MTRFSKILLIVIGLESIGLAFLLFRRATTLQLPEVNWRLFEEATAGDVRKLEDRILRSKGGQTSRDPGQWFEIAETYRAFGLFPQAEYCYRQLQELAPHDPTYLYHWGIVMDLLGQTTEASKRYREAIKLGGPRLERVPSALAIQYCWLAIGQDRLREEQIEPAREALRQAPDLPKAQWLLARVMIRSGDAEKAIPMLDRLLLKNPEILELNEMRAWAAEELGHAEEALRFQDLALRSSRHLERMEPTFQSVQKRRDAMGASAAYHQSIAAEKKGQLEEAATLARKSLNASWEEAKAVQLAKLETMLGRHQKVIEVMKEANEREGASSRTMNVIGVASMMLRDHQQAVDAWENACRIQPTSGIYHKLVFAAKARGDRKEAQRYSALEEYFLGRTALEKSDLLTAQRHLETASQGLPDDASISFYLAETRRALGDSAGAVAGYQRCVQINPGHGRARRSLERLKR